MHQALRIYEILYQIFAHFRVEEDLWHSKTNTWKILHRRKALARIARTCKAFTDPALDILWEKQTSLMPLLKVLSSFHRRADGTYCIDQGILSPDWERFKIYAKRVRIFTYSPDNRIHSSVYASLARARGNSPLMPLLRSMSWSHIVDASEDTLLFISESLQSAKIGRLLGFTLRMEEPSFSDVVHDQEILIGSLAAAATHLQDLTIEGPMSLGCLFSITQLQYLRFLDLSGAGSWTDLDTFHSLGNLKSLTELRINVNGLDLDDRNTETPFRALQVLQISGSPSSMTPIFCAISSPSLRSITIRTTYSHSPAEWHSCLDAFRHQFQNTVTEFQMKLLMGELSLKDECEHIMLFAFPLLALDRLEVLVLDLEGPLRITDADIHEMACAWRSLRQFRIWCHKSGDGPTLQSIASCARLCPHLIELELPADARFPSQFSSITSDEAPVPSLQKLTLLGNVGCEGSSFVADYLHRLFPSLRHFDAYSWDNKTNDRLTKVQEMIPTLSHPVRKQPRVNTSRSAKIDDSIKRMV